ncbi:ste6-like protein [Flagelloscypha sp. PMI_526]|nr:ste6-like protein [Flagelloscypha sp. PMI_526]
MAEKTAETKDIESLNEKDVPEVQVDAPAKPKKPPPVAFFELFRYATKFEICLNILSLFAAAAAGVAQPAMTLLFGRLVQDFANFGITLARIQMGDTSAQGSFEQARKGFKAAAALNASYLTYIGIGMFVCSYIYMMVWGWTSEVQSKRLREAYLRATLRQDIAYFDNVGGGEIATRIQTDTALVQKGNGEKVALSVMTGSAFLAGYIIAYSQEWRLALALTSVLPVIMISGTLMNKAVGKNIMKALGFIAEAGSIAEEVISSVRTVQAFGIQNTLLDVYNVFVLKARVAGKSTAKWLAFALSIIIASIYMSYALAFYFGTTLVIQGHTQAGTIVNVIFAILIGTFSIVQLTPEIQAIQEARGAAAKLYATIDRTPDIDSYSDEGKKPDKVDGNISLENIRFHYPSRPNVEVVKGISLHFRAGTTSALVGASGSGKSTAIALIERFYDPIEGVVKLDGVDIRELNLQWMRSQIGLVSQEPTLFDTTVAMNVAHGLINTPHEHLPWEEKLKLVKAACVTSNADSFITKLPDGYETVVGERAILLSGGQKQRIAIARAIVSDPTILLLDEATSALDTQSEGIVQDALNKASKGRTTITIAHRLSTIKDADIIYQGTHNDLAQKIRESSQEDSSTGTVVGDSSSESGADGSLVIQEDELPLERTKTARSLASQVIEDKTKEAESKKVKTYNVFHLFMRMVKLNRMSWRIQIISLFCALITGAVFPVYGIVFSQAIQGFSAIKDSDKRSQGDRNALWLFIIGIVVLIAMFIQNLGFVLGAVNLMALLRQRLFSSILRQDIAFFDEAKHSTGALVSMLSDDPQKVNGLAGMIMGTMTQAVSTLVIGYIIGLSYTWKIGLVGIACTPLVIFCGMIRLQVVVLKDKRNKREHEYSAQVACEAAGAIRTVAALTREKDCVDVYSKVLEVPLQRTNKTNVWANMMFAFAQAISFWVISLVFWFGSRLVASLDISVTQFFVGLMSTTFAAIQAGNLFNFSADMSEAGAAARSLVEIFDSMPEIDAQSPDGKQVNTKTSQGKITFRDVHFRYPTRPSVRVLSGLNLEVQPGTFVALVGASGCGKSTSIQLIERFYDPLAGVVLLDDEPLSSLNVESFRSQISLVSQEPTLYSGTVKYNVMLGANKPESEVTQEEIEEACRNANILDFINSLPDRFDTQVGGKGSQLSGGQKQRIAIARALLRNPKVLLLDEATSALDSTSEKVVQAALDQAAKGRTTIAIAHRLSTIQNADRIYFIKEGRASEWGTHEELLAKKGDYYSYVQLQQLSKRV